MGRKTYTNEQYKFSIDHPSTWTVKELDYGIEIENNHGSVPNSSTIRLYPKPVSEEFFTATGKFEITKFEIGINVGDMPTVFAYYNDPVQKLSAYSYVLSREPFNIVEFSISQNTLFQDDDLVKIKEILASYKNL